MPLDITIRFGQLSDLEILQFLFVETINSTCQKDYTKEQLEAWISGVENKDRWVNIITNQYLLIAENNDVIVGFCSLDNGNYIDLLFIHKDFQRQGIAHTLYLTIEKEAKKQNQILLTADVSKTAKPFFEKIGFNVATEQIVIKKGIELINYKMKKELTELLN
ncbi:GNAT family N-acetyltransferase [Flavobacterium sediminilitoris]|uniref:GNAT family N-acetyltransferase n=1 Tax=Flavobacterium sediminilitoris TaxID=2024526 RepID=A0ABY4HPI9_9FLAO|nr:MULTISPECIES: GNAT family N-acetyltransferase [Flavobacterium]UOX34217.1 GNAT family N-acetyltransferase [Flavobacterium sediminilitoris]